MKFRLTALIIFLSLVLVACSSARVITPTPGNKPPTPLPTLSTVTPVPEATSTVKPASATGGITPAITQSNTPVAVATATPGTTLGNFTGTMVNGSGGEIPDGQNVALVGLDQDQAGNYQKALELQSQVNRDGKYSFTGVEVSLNRAFIVITNLRGIQYQSDPILVKDATMNFSIPITIYDQTNDFKVLSTDQVHLKFDYSSQNVIQVTELYVVTNPGKQAVVVSSDGTKIPFLQIPVGAGNVKYQLAQGSAQLLSAPGGFALLPGADRQYGFLVSFSLPYSRSLKYDQPFILPVSSLTIFVPQGMHLGGEKLVASGSQTIQSQIYLTYQSNKMAAGSSLSLALSGKPGASTGFQSTRQTIILICIVVVGILLIGVGIYLYLRDRRRFLKEEQEELEDQYGQIEEAALGEDRENM